MFSHYAVTLTILFACLASSNTLTYNWTKCEDEIIAKEEGPVCKDGTDKRCSQESILCFIPGMKQEIYQVSCTTNNLAKDKTLPDHYCSIQGGTTDVIGDNRTIEFDFDCKLFAVTM
ncbi:hypothetical protein WDU94_014757 [Cyamophila willieti]